MIVILIIVAAVAPLIAVSAAVFKRLRAERDDAWRVRDNYRDALNDECKAHGALQRRVDNTMVAMDTPGQDTDAHRYFLSEFDCPAGARADEQETS